jgi:hypothetical protein
MGTIPPKNLTSINLIKKTSMNEATKNFEFVLVVPNKADVLTKHDAVKKMASDKFAAHFENFNEQANATLNELKIALSSNDLETKLAALGDGAENLDVANANMAIITGRQQITEKLFQLEMFGQILQGEGVIPFEKFAAKTDPTTGEIIDRGFVSTPLPETESQEFAEAMVNYEAVCHELVEVEKDIKNHDELVKYLELNKDNTIFNEVAALLVEKRTEFAANHADLVKFMIAGPIGRVPGQKPTTTTTTKSGGGGKGKLVGGYGIMLPDGSEFKAGKFVPAICELMRAFGIEEFKPTAKLTILTGEEHAESQKNWVSGWAPAAKIVHNHLVEAKKTYAKLPTPTPEQLRLLNLDITAILYSQTITGEWVTIDQVDYSKVKKAEETAQ